MKRLIYLFLLLPLLASLTSCIEDGFDNSPSAQPVFSVDTLHMGVYFTDQPTPTRRFTVHNRNSKLISISDISIREAGSKIFRINVDGFSGTTFHNVEIRPNDSIFILVEATLPVNSAPMLTDVEAHLDFITNGVSKTVVLSAKGQDVDRRRGVTVSSDQTWGPGYPYQIFDSLVVAPGATLTLDAGTSLHFHDKAYMRVYGRLVTLGTPEAPVNMAGDRTDNVVGNISFDLMASQWEGLHFAPESRGNSLSHTVIRNTSSGVIADSLSQVTFLNCRLRNSADYSLVGRYADLTLIGTEVAEAASGLFGMMGGNVTANHCTFANYYLFSALRGASLQFYHFSEESDNGSGMPLLKADITNSVIYGNGNDLSAADLTGTAITLRRCALKSEGSDDDNFIDCLWGEDPLYATVREDYHFDYRLLDGSPLAGAADPALTLPEARSDFYGTSRLPTPSIGAYQQPAPQE